MRWLVERSETYCSPVWEEDNDHSHMVKKYMPPLHRVPIVNFRSMTTNRNARSAALSGPGEVNLQSNDTFPESRFHNGKKDQEPYFTDLHRRIRG